MTSLSLVPLSIPSPPDSWSTLVTIPFDQWFSAVGLDFGQAVQIHTYAICILLGIIAATMLTRASPHHARRRARDRHRHHHLGGAARDHRRPFCTTCSPTRATTSATGADPWEIIRIWEGGNAIFGALIGGAVGAYIGCRITGIRFWSFADALAPAMLLAQAIGRLGN